MIARAAAFDDLGEQRPAKAAELVLLAVEIGFVDGEAVDEFLRFLLVVAQESVIIRESSAAGDIDPLGNAAVDVVTLFLFEEHSGPPIDEGAEAAEFVGGQRPAFFAGRSYRHCKVSIREAAMRSSGA